jgi:alpha-glucosidase
MRPLFYEFPDALDARCEQPTAFLLGDRLLIAPPPNLESAATYSVCLPAGGWYDYWSGLKVTATVAPDLRHAQRLPITPALDQLPVFVRAGAILPSQPLVQSTAETPQGPLVLDIYPGDDCRGVIYLDDGHSVAYRQGAFLRQIVRCSQTATGIEIQFEAREGQFQPWWSRIEVRVHEMRGRARAQLNGRPLQSVQTSTSRMLTVLIDDQRGPARLSIDQLQAGALHTTP